ncbi:ROK family transcriptional regulator [Actinomadura madurae]|uniref:ROK family transcriptional regulator n=1 Tax=Actinomadura madurae TaxID=1993 RepID=UPI0020D200A9|nr:ROK family transcriptional regulator [Actinomadura madurae]MCP9952445.1 ROK family protein [Actinomadura madurae]MCP9969202.1 ROK family protein [Actinomadura madurae]MCP9981679.1 ROK family protein [Actinomadura madurae]MCQ0006811.1 ROK family protein [Actinomadura madurae]MCQ0017881.1 ROK family protein [Actinomadura madurae]
MSSSLLPGTGGTGRVSPATRRRTMGILLREVHRDGAVSRTELAARMGVNRSTILTLIAKLADAGLVREEPSAATGRSGRPSLVVRPEPGRAYVLAFDVAMDRLVAARVGLGGTVLERREALRRRGRDDLEDVVAVLAGFGRALVAAAPPDAACAGVGASFCGLIRAADGKVRLVPARGWTDLDFGPALGERLGLDLPVKVGNEAHLGAFAELERGAGAGSRNLVYLHGDIGVGGGIIVGGKPLHGDDGYAAELGHMIVNPYGGRPCNCGSRGCLEAEVGEAALLAAAGRAGGPVGREGVRAVVDAAEAGDEAARRALERVGDWLGIGVTNLINLFNPGVVVFGGMLQEIYRGAASQVRARVAASGLPVSREHVELRTAALGYESTLVGAAELGFAALLADPLGVLGA